MRVHVLQRDVAEYVRDEKPDWDILGVFYTEGQAKSMAEKLMREKRPWVDDCHTDTVIACIASGEFKIDTVDLY